MKNAVALLLVAALASCSQEVPNIPPPAHSPAAAPAAPAAATTAAVAPDKLDADHFSAVAAPADCSGGKVTSARVRWDAGGTGATGVSIYVESPGNQRKLWMDGGGKGEATTGPWVFEGTRFTIQDKATGEVLGTRLVPQVECQG